MSTTEERIERIHKRAGELKRETDLKLMRIGTTVSAALGLFLFAAIGYLILVSGGNTPGTVSDAGYAGTSMLESSVGGYVLVALVAFMLGAVLTVLIRSYHEKNKNQDNKSSGSDI